MITIITGRAEHQHQHAAAMAAGLKRHGLAAQIAQPHHRPQQGETVICWGWRIGAGYRAAGAEVLVMERGYIGDRFVYTSLAWNGLNNRGSLPVVEDGGQRFAKLWPKALKPECHGGDYSLIVGQVPGDASLQGKDLYPWYCAQAQEAAQCGRQARFRPHPLAHRRSTVRAVPGAPTLGGNLEDALKGAFFVVTYNSNTGVDALLAGKPTFVEDEGGMAYGVGLEQREPWAHRLAWRQFSLAEIENGLAWGVACGAH